MLDHDHRIALVNEPVEDSQQLADVLEVEAGGRLVEDVDGVTGGSLGQLAGQLDPLGLAARQGGRRLSQPHVAQTHVDQRLHVTRDGRLILEELQGLVTWHIQYVSDGPSLEPDIQGVAVVPLAPAHLARDVYVGQKVHLDPQRAVARASITPAALHVEAEPTRLVSANPGLLGPGEQLPDVVEHTGVGGGVGAGCPPDRRLIDVDDLVDPVHSLQGRVKARRHLGPVHLLHQGLVEDFVYQGGLPGPRYSGNSDKAPQGELHVQVPQVVLPGTAYQQVIATGRPSDLGHRDHLLSRKVLAGQRTRALQEPSHVAGVNDVSPVLACTRPDVHHVIGCPDGLLVVLHHDHRVPEVPEALQGLDEAPVVPLVKADGRLV